MILFNCEASVFEPKSNLSTSTSSPDAVLEPKKLIENAKVDCPAFNVESVEFNPPVPLDLTSQSTQIPHDYSLNSMSSQHQFSVQKSTKKRQKQLARHRRNMSFSTDSSSSDSEKPSEIHLANKLSRKERRQIKKIRCYCSKDIKIYKQDQLFDRCKLLIAPSAKQIPSELLK